MSTKAQIWRVLDLGGLTKSVRDSRNFTRAGYVYKDGQRVTSLKSTVSLGSPFTLELQFPSGRTISKEIMVVPWDKTLEFPERSLDPLTKKYRG